ncbi:MAG: bifunctional diaminohydroxyphosphoribosylaminopyrimidine deaminase/5-amino-6-(5-phosphoribosylamino)uracil reductase RibD [Bacteroidota bacterium]
MLNHETYMRRCIYLARLGGSYVFPNPLVGCVIVKNNKIIGEGYHKLIGEAHAEVNAVESVEDKSEIANATVYVSLEPCSHFGKTPPCTDLLIDLKVKEVVIGCVDINPKVAGKGIEKLQRSGINVVIGILEEECKQLNKRFFTFHEKQRPYVILKWAQTIDGFLDRVRQNEEHGVNWISAPETKALVHKWRAEEHAILVGRNTILYDNPSLTVRDFHGKNPIRIIVDSQLQLKNDMNVFSKDAPTIIFNRIKNHRNNNVEWVKISETSTSNILFELHQRGIQSIFVEGGSRTLQYFIVDNVWDEARIIVGKQQFNNGIKAPVINKIPAFSQQFGDDLLHYFYRK